MSNRKAFTLIEVLISVALLGIILPPLFSVVEMMRTSNEHLLTSLEKTKQVTKATKVLFLDILGSDGNIEIKKDEFARLCIEDTSNSLYNLSGSKVCWVVLKEDNVLARIEGHTFNMPLKSEDRVEVDTVASNIELFDAYHEKDKIVVSIKEVGKKPLSFLVQGIRLPLSAVTSQTQNVNNANNVSGQQRRPTPNTLPNKAQELRDSSGNPIYGYDGKPRKKEIKKSKNKKNKTNRNNRKRTNGRNSRNNTGGQNTNPINGKQPSNPAKTNTTGQTSTVR
ncbi:MAG: prepilin-type N-terminal cleavage/methylation domain-containing protein [Campylobacterota bacterium]|nr:prepilin-type N-terminal cleavage/methylation domain-containing protein [Campylobacterota bacterium]